jgi:hypothetical protein
MKKRLTPFQAEQAEHREQGKALPNLSKEQLSLYQQATKLEKAAVMHLYSDKAAWKARDRQTVDKL